MNNAAGTPHPVLDVPSNERINYYLLAFGLVLTAIAARLSLTPLLGEQAPFIIFTLAIIGSAWKGGLGPGLFATCLSMLAGRYLFIEPTHSLTLPDMVDTVRLSLFLITSLVISAMCDSMHRTRRSLEAEVLRARMAEQARQESQNHLTLVVDALPALISYIDLDLRYRLANRAYKDWFGVEPHQVVGMPVRELLGEEAYAAHEAYLLAALGGETVQFEMKTPHHRRGALDTSVLYIPDQDASGKVRGFFVFLRDITERKQTENELRRSEAQFRQMADALPQFAWTASAEGVVEWFNERWYEYTGATVEQSVGAEWVKCMHPDDVEPMVTQWTQALLSGEMFEQEHRVRSTDGRYRWFLARGLPLREEGGAITRWFGTCTDIQDLLDARRQAESASTAKSEFLANMSHEIRTPMNAIVGLTALLSARPTLQGRDRQFVDTLKESADSLMLLINDILDFAKIESSMVELERMPFSPRDVLEGCHAILLHEAERKGLSFECDLQLPPALWLSGDALRLRQIVMNLLSNAIKFTQAGRIRLMADYGEAGLLSIRVADTGIGMSQQTVADIFEKFTQADASMTRRFGGTGLGLAITRSLVELMGGAIRVESSLAQGSAFLVELPMARAAAVEASSVRIRQPASQLPVAPILLVEDNEANILVATSMLEVMGYGCEVARSGREALEKLDARPFSLILMDVQMQGMDGCETAATIRRVEAQGHRSRLPIVAMTAHATSGDRERCFKAGMDDYLTKPFLLAMLQEKIDFHLRQPAAISA